MEICKICNQEFKTMKSLAMHVKRTHGMSSEDYYLKYLGERGICTCGTLTKYRNMVQGYSKHCCGHCSFYDPDVVKKREATNISKFGVKSACASKEVRDRIKKTLNAKYGVDYTFQSSSIRKKSNKTVKDKYGVDNVMSLDSIQKKRIERSLVKYGTEHPMQNKTVQEKSQETMLVNHGVRFPAQSQLIKNKQIKTNIERYGVPVAIQSLDILAKRTNTNIEKYGYSTPLKNSIVKAKSKSTCQEKYGVDHPGSSVSAHNKRKNTTLERYGVDCLFKSSDIKDKIRKTNLDRYGVENPNQNVDIKEKIKHTVYQRVFDSHINLFELYDCKLTKYTDQIFTYSCNKCGETCDEGYQFVKICRFEKNISPCTSCFPKQSRISFMEREVSSYIDSNYDNIIIYNDISEISPKELDIYLPDIGIAIEFNGLFYHSEVYKNNDYHINKTNACNEKNIQLIHIYEDDWLYKTDIVKSRINNFLGISTRIYARKCVVKEVNSTEANAFLNVNHIQGKCRSSHKYGLYYNDELVSLMTFGKSRFADEFELIRFCNKLNTTVVGGASKLFKYFIRNHTDIESIISYADRSWSIGNLYEKLGFKFDSITSPGYSYVNGNVRDNRMKYQKHKLVAEGYDKNMTEHEIMLSRKLYRIYDSGNLKYIWTR